MSKIVCVFIIKAFPTSFFVFSKYNDLDNVLISLYLHFNPK